jgi:hypothetical protein
MYDIDVGYSLKGSTASFTCKKSLVIILKNPEKLAAARQRDVAGSMAAARRTAPPAAMSTAVADALPPLLTTPTATPKT